MTLFNMDAKDVIYGIWMFIAVAVLLFGENVSIGERVLIVWCLLSTEVTR